MFLRIFFPGNVQVYMLSRALQRAGSAINPRGGLAELHMNNSPWITDAGVIHLVSKLPSLTSLSLTCFSDISSGLASQILNTTVRPTEE